VGPPREKKVWFVVTVGWLFVEYSQMHERRGSVSRRPGHLRDGAEGKVGSEGGEVKVGMGSWHALPGGLTEREEGSQRGRLKWTNGQWPEPIPWVTPSPVTRLVRVSESMFFI